MWGPEVVGESTFLALLYEKYQPWVGMAKLECKEVTKECKEVTKEGN